MEIWLYFDTHGITQQQWEPVWNECHAVLQYFPVPLTSPFWVTMLTVYASLRDREINFWAWRKHIFEMPALWTAMRDVFVKAAKGV